MPENRSWGLQDRCSTALEEAGIDRNKVYVTNAVKHFIRAAGKIRQHQKPTTGEIKACRQWHERELVSRIREYRRFVDDLKIAAARYENRRMQLEA